MPKARITVLKIAAKAAKKKVEAATTALENKQQALNKLKAKSTKAIEVQEAKVAEARAKRELLNVDFQFKRKQLEDEFPDADDSSS